MSESGAAADGERGSARRTVRKPVGRTKREFLVCELEACLERKHILVLNEWGPSVIPWERSGVIKSFLCDRVCHVTRKSVQTPFTAPKYSLVLKCLIKFYFFVR